MHGCGRVNGGVCVCLCAWVCVCIFHSFIDGGDSCLLSHHLWCQYSMHQPHTSRTYCYIRTSSTAHFFPPLPHPSPSSSISPCSEVEHESFSTWVGYTGVVWAILGRQLSVTAVPSTCVHVSTMMSGLWSSPTH